MAKNKTETADVRQRIAEDLESVYDEKVSAFFHDALDATKKIWVSCRHCNRKSEVDIPDWTARTRALQLLIEQGFGRPGTAETEPGNITIILEDVWPPRNVTAEDYAKLQAAYPVAGLPEIPGVKSALLEAGWTPPSEPTNGVSENSTPNQTT